MVASPCAGAALYRRRAIEEVGGFDERFFAYLEDADWGLRSQLAGWRCLWVPSAVAHHLGGATSRRMGDLETELIARNTLALVLKSFPAARLLAWSPLILGYQAYALARAVRPARGAPYCAAGARAPPSPGHPPSAPEVRPAPETRTRSTR